MNSTMVKVCSPRVFDRLRPNGGGRLWFVLLPVAQRAALLLVGWVALWSCIRTSAHGQAPTGTGFRSRQDACGRAWGHGCPCKTGRKPVAVGAGFWLGFNSMSGLGLLPQRPWTGSGRTVAGVCGLFGFLSRRGLPSYELVDCVGVGLGPGRYRVSQQAGMPAVGLGGMDAPARPGESRWRLGPGFGSGSI
jgi:hypothetical protein